MASVDAVTAVRRLGLGPKPGDIKRIASDARAYVLASVADPAAARLEAAELLPSHTLLADLRTAQMARKEQRQATTAQHVPPSTTMPAARDPAPSAPAETPKPGEIRREAFRDDATARIRRALTTDTPFLERLVMFWSGHFCVSASKGPVRALAGAFEREAIRPHVLGRFADMLRAVEQHPAMLIYLDNVNSTGPNSRAGITKGKGLNENLARETLELHTLGVDGGYTQADVTNLARLVTGWTVGGLEQDKVEPGRFMFAPFRHEPGPHPVLGKTYDGSGSEAGERCLNDLARHPSTARHIARRLAVHFVAADPPPPLVERLAKAFRDSDGDLKVVATTLATSPEVWDPRPRKVAPPYDFLVAVARGFAINPPAPELLRVMAGLGQPLWTPPSPAGWPSADDAWMAPSSLRERLRVAEKAARLVDRLSDPRIVADDLLGPAQSEATRQAIAHAETREQGFELLVMAPEFLRR